MDVSVEGVEFQVSNVTGIGVEDQASGPGPFDYLGVMRRDPSDVIQINDSYYVFYTKTARYPNGEEGGQVPSWPTSGYWGTVWYATSSDGVNWTEQSEVLGTAEAGAWDSNGVFTPNVVQGIDDEYYLYYTGVQDGFQNNSTTDVAQLGVAQLAIDQEGLISGATRLNNGNPILSPTFNELDSRRSPKFDSFRIDDASLLMRDFDGDGELEYGLYYKGRAQSGSPSQTKMGLAIGDSPIGPFVRQNEGDPVQPEGHEVQIWAYGAGVMSLATSAGAGLWYAEDGIHFVQLTDNFSGTVKAPGAFRPELTDHTYTAGIKWGVSMIDQANRYLMYYNIALTPSQLDIDLNGDGMISEVDWMLYRAGFGADLSELTLAEAYQMGDLNGDFVNDELDFHLFKTAYESANGAVAFSQLGVAVPEPGTLGSLVAGALLASCRWRAYWKHKAARNPSWVATEQPRCKPKYELGIGRFVEHHAR